MTAANPVVPGLVPPSVTQSIAVREPPRSVKVHPLPMVDMGALPRDVPRIYGIATVDGGGRVTDQHVIRALGWGPNERVDVTTSSGSVIVRAHADGVFTLTRKAHLQIPAVVRRWCALTAGDRVLLVAIPDLGLLIVHAVTALDLIVERYHELLIGGDAK